MKTTHCISPFCYSEVSFDWCFVLQVVLRCTIFVVTFHGSFISCIVSCFKFNKNLCFQISRISKFSNNLCGKKSMYTTIILYLYFISPLLFTVKKSKYDPMFSQFLLPRNENWSQTSDYFDLNWKTVCEQAHYETSTSLIFLRSSNILQYGTVNDYEICL